MSEELKILVIFIIGLSSAYFGSFASGGVSVLSVGLLTLLGIPPQMATITFKLGKVGDALGGVFLFHKHGHIPTRYVTGGAIAAIIGSFFGSYIIFSIPDRLIYFVSALTMLILTAVSLHKKAGLKKSEPVSRAREGWYYVFLTFLTMIGNIFIAGSGVWYHFTNIFFLRLSAMEAKAYGTTITLFWMIGTIGGVFMQGRYVISWALALGLGMLIGGYFGTKHIIKIGNHALRNILLGTIIIFAIYFLYLSFHV